LRELLQYVQEETLTRPKSELSRAYHAKNAFEQVVLAGVSPALVLSRVLQKTSGFFGVNGKGPIAASIAPPVKEVG